MSKSWPASTLAILGLLCACASPGAPDPGGPPGRLSIIATTGMIGDAARQIAGPHSDVLALMGPGVDPHLYKASQGDVGRLGSANLILYNGLHLEGKMGDILVKLARSRPVVAVSEALPQERLREPPEFAGQYDPHIWFDVALWSECLSPIASALGEIDPQHADEYRANAERYRTALLELDTWAEQRILEIPPAQRVLVTAHDAFGYFGRRYGMRVVGLQGISTLAEAGLQDMQRVVDVVVENRIKAIFVESSVPRRSIEAVRSACLDRGHEVSIGGQLFSDAMGAADSPEGTYVGMVRYNVNTIVGALR